MRYFRHFLVYLWLLVLCKQITGDAFIKNRQIHTDIDLACSEPQGSRRWFYKQAQDSPLVPITAANGSHYEIQSNIAGLRIFNSLESDEGIYVVQGDGGVECIFILNIFGIFSYNSGTKNPSTGNYEQTIEVVDNYAVTVECGYNITGVSDAYDTFVNVDAIVNNANVEECTQEEYPYCTDCKVCFPTTNNPYRFSIVYPKLDSGSTTMVCRVNLGTDYNGKTVDKHVTFSRTTVSHDSYVVPYNSTYQLCSNAPGEKEGVILTTEFSNGIPINQDAFSLNQLPISVLREEINISCQSLNSFPNAEEIYIYNIKLSAIPDLTNIRLDETIDISYCGNDSSSEVKRTFNCSYEFIGNSDGQQQQQQQSVSWELDGTACSEETCLISGEYSQINRMDLRAVGRDKEEYILRCYVALNGAEYSREWSIRLMFEVCGTSRTTTLITTSTTTERITTTTATTTPTTTPDIPIITTDPNLAGQTDPGVIAGIIFGTLLCFGLLIILLVLIGIALVIVYYQFFSHTKSYSTRSAQSIDTKLRNWYSHLPKLRRDGNYSKQLDNTTQGDISITV